jgi:hypothetical protein
MSLLARALFLVCVTAALAACAADVSRSVCEGFQARVRIVDPLADQKMVRDQVSCDAYEAERARLLRQPPQ